MDEDGKIMRAGHKLLGSILRSEYSVHVLEIRERCSGRWELSFQSCYPGDGAGTPPAPAFEYKNWVKGQLLLDKDLSFFHLSVEEHRHE